MLKISSHHTMGTSVAFFSTTDPYVIKALVTIWIVTANIGRIIQPKDGYVTTVQQGYETYYNNRLVTLEECPIYMYTVETL